MPPPRRLPRTALCLLLAAANGLLFLLLELGVRIYFATQVGAPILLYGSDWYRERERAVYERNRRDYEESEQQAAGIHRHHVGRYRDYESDQIGSYSKYLPNQTKTLVSATTGETISARINNHGFRGADFALEKPPGVRRVLTLGASSTFGYGNADTETYPYQLEQILNREGAGRRTEVINFTVPHATLDHIVSMFLAEGLALEPDFVTLYAGANDSAVVEEGDGALGRVGRALASRLLSVAFARPLLRSALGPSTQLWSEDYARRRSEAFLRNVEALRHECAARGIRFIVATQQAKSLVVPKDAIQGLGYADEVRLVQARWQERRVGVRGTLDTWLRASAAVEKLPTGRGGPTRRFLANLDKMRIFLVHARLMDDLRAWAARRDVAFVDVIAALDGERQLLHTWVHLEPEANRSAAAAFAREILRWER